jgi:hypothetical protein
MPSELTDTARLKALECAIQEAIGVSDCMNVAVTGVAAARRAGSSITYEVSPHKRCARYPLNGVGVR